MKKSEIEVFKEKAQKIFPTHKKIYLRVKKNPKVPFSPSIFEHAILLRKEHPLYEFYIHEDYIRFKSTSIKNAVPTRDWMDDKRWVELFFIFELDEEKNGQKEKKKKKKKYK